MAGGGGRRVIWGESCCQRRHLQKLQQKWGHPHLLPLAGLRRRTTGHVANVRLEMRVPSHGCKEGMQIRTSVDKEVDLEGSKWEFPKAGSDAWRALHSGGDVQDGTEGAVAVIFKNLKTSRINNLKPFWFERQAHRRRSPEKVERDGVRADLGGGGCWGLAREIMRSFLEDPSGFFFFFLSFLVFRELSRRD